MLEHYPNRKKPAEAGFLLSTSDFSDPKIVKKTKIYLLANNQTTVIILSLLGDVIRLEISTSR
jgi:hypothetical protein